MVDRFDQASATRMNTITLCPNCSLLRYRSCSCALCSLPVPPRLPLLPTHLGDGSPRQPANPHYLYSTPLHCQHTLVWHCSGMSGSFSEPSTPCVHSQERDGPKEVEGGGEGRGRGRGRGGEREGRGRGRGGERSSLTNTSAGIVSCVDASSQGKGLKQYIQHLLSAPIYG